MDQMVGKPVNLRQTLRDIVREPFRTLVPPWSWKAAAFAASMRGAAFFATNLQAGRGEATKALVVEAVFAIFAGGLIGAISQHLRNAEPLWATAAVVLDRFAGHYAARTDGCSLARTYTASQRRADSFIPYFGGLSSFQLVCHASWCDVGGI